MKLKCKHCGSTNVSDIYIDSFPESGNDQDEFTQWYDLELFDCFDCGELAQEVFKTKQ